MKTKEEIVKNWLPRYTKRPLEDFAEYILLTNFDKYVELFAERFNVPVLGHDANMISATANGMTIINFGMGSPNAAIIMDLLGAIKPKACLFFRKMWGYRQEEQDRRFRPSSGGYPWRRYIERLLPARSACIARLYASTCRVFGYP